MARSPTKPTRTSGASPLSRRWGAYEAPAAKHAAEHAQLARRLADARQAHRAGAAGRGLFARQKAHLATARRQRSEVAGPAASGWSRGSGTCWRVPARASEQQGLGSSQSGGLSCTRLRRDQGVGGEVGADPPRELLERRRGPGHLGPMSASERARSRAAHKLLQTPLTVGSELLPALGGLLHHARPGYRKCAVN